MNVLILMGSPRLHGNTADNLPSFQTKDAVAGAKAFARKLVK